jgi:hypothetical protein
MNSSDVNACAGIMRCLFHNIIRSYIISYVSHHEHPGYYILKLIADN